MPEPGKRDIHETLEVLVAMGELGEFMAKRLKDGVGLDDAMALATKLASDSEFRDILVKAGTGMKNIDDEFKDLDLSEMKQLVDVGSENMFKIIEAIRKKKE